LLTFASAACLRHIFYAMLRRHAMLIIDAALGGAAIRQSRGATPPRCCLRRDKQIIFCRATPPHL